MAPRTTTTTASVRSFDCVSTVANSLVCAGLGRKLGRLRGRGRLRRGRPLAEPHRLGVLGHVEDREELGLVENHLFTREARQVVEAGQLDRLDGAGLLAHPAVDAAELVDDEALA